VLRILRQSEALYGLWLGLLIALLVPGLLYPPIGIANRLSVRFDQTLPLTLDGLAFMSHARYMHNDREIDLRPDAEAIAWLNENIAGMPVFATSELEFYRAYGMRVAANTGLPTVLGRLHQDEQRPAAQVIERERDVQTLFNTSDSQAALRVLAKYDVDYVYVGSVERALYDPAGIARFAAWQGSALERVYGNDGVHIYRVNKDVVSQFAATATPAAVEEALTPSIEEQIAGVANDSGAAFGLAMRLIEQNRLEDAASVLVAAAQQHPGDVPMHHLLGDVLARIGRPDEAIAAWRQAATTQPTGQNVNKLGQGLTQIGRYDEAIAAFNEALALDPAFPDPHFFLAELYRMRDGDGDRERARESYQRYLDRAPPDALWRASAEDQLRLLGR
jgi:tetratricopeptide (TPR) repeat protein